MIDSKHKADNDPDLILASQFEAVLAGELEVEDINDPIFTVLVQARNVVNRSEMDIPLSSSEKSWRQIQKSIERESTTNRILHWPTVSIRKWQLAAAAMMLIAFTSLFLLLQSVDTDPRLLAESGSSISVVVLADGSTVTLRPNSRLYELGSTDQLQRYSLNGEALFEVELHPSRTFSVEAGPGRVVVSGTRFNLSDRDERSTIHLLEGSVLFETVNNEKSLSLRAGEAAVINPDYRLEPSYAFESDYVISWTLNRLSFRDRPVADILSELEFHYNITIRVPNEIEQITLGSSVALESPEQSLHYLGTVLAGEFVQTDDRTFQFRRLP